MTQTSVMAATVFASEAVPNSATAPGQPKIPVVTLAVSGAQAQRFERVIITDVNIYGESIGSSEVVIQVPANNVIVVSQFETKYTGDYQGKPYGFNVYVTTGATNTETKQNTTPVVTGQSWQEPAAGLIAGSALPTTVAPIPGDVANANVINTPTAPGSITVPQSPSGAVVTNTGRTLEATQSYMAASLNILNVGTTPGRPVIS